jgi:hypothetical protein
LFSFYHTCIGRYIFNAKMGPCCNPTQRTLLRKIPLQMYICTYIWLRYTCTEVCTYIGTWPYRRCRARVFFNIEISITVPRKFRYRQVTSHTYTTYVLKAKKKVFIPRRAWYILWLWTLVPFGCGIKSHLDTYSKSCSLDTIFIGKHIYKLHTYVHTYIGTSFQLCAYECMDVPM